MSTPVTTRASAAAMQQAFDALRAYAPGSPRGALVALDEAITAATADPAQARELETRLLGVLESHPSAEAVDYICRKLALIGSGACVPAMTTLLRNPASAHAGRSVLEVLPGPEAGDALRSALPALSGLAQLEAIIALGMRREAASVPVLTPLLKDGDGDGAKLAAGALGEIANMPAGEALREYMPTAPAALRPALGDAGLACAGRLATHGEKTLAAELYRLLAGPEQSAHVRSAAELGQKRLTAGA